MVDVYNIERVDSAYVYKWTDWSNGKYYIGVHNGKDKNYLGSGVIFKKAYSKRPWAFTREILFTGSYEDCLSVEEKELTFVDAANNNRYYNLSNSVGSKGRTQGKEERLRKSKALTGRKFSEQHKQNLSLSHKNRDKSTYKRGDVTKRVYCEYLDSEFNSIKELALALEISASYVCNILKGRKNNNYGIKYIYDAR